MSNDWTPHQQLLPFEKAIDIEDSSIQIRRKCFDFHFEIFWKFFLTEMKPRLFAIIKPVFSRLKDRLKLSK